MDEYQVCVDKKCSVKQKLMLEIEDAFNHWGHEKVPFLQIHNQVKNKDNVKRFQEMITVQDVQTFISQQINTLIQNVTGQLLLLQRSFESQIAKIKDENKPIKQLFNEISKDLTDINFQYIIRCNDGWDRLQDSSKDSVVLHSCKKLINDTISQLFKDLTSILQININGQNSRPIEQLITNLQIVQDQNIKQNLNDS